MIIDIVSWRYQINISTYRRSYPWISVTKVFAFTARIEQSVTCLRWSKFYFKKSKSIPFRKIEFDLLVSGRKFNFLQIVKNSVYLKDDLIQWVAQAYLEKKNSAECF